MYEALKAMGHSPTKAAEIVIAALGGDAYAKAWVKEALRQQAIRNARVPTKRKPR